jgi:hypothetical protein
MMMTGAQLLNKMISQLVHMILGHAISMRFPRAVERNVVQALNFKGASKSRHIGRTTCLLFTAAYGRLTPIAVFGNCGSALKDLEPINSAWSRFADENLEFGVFVMHIESPTRREIWLAVLLLVSLLFVSRSRPDFVLSPSIQSGPSDKPATQNSTHVEQEIPPQPLRDRIRWGAGEIPQTKIVAHVPGEWWWKALPFYIVHN